MHDRAITTLPAALAQRQLDAYNAHDLEAFLACYADDVEVFELPSMSCILRGTDALRGRYGPYFAQHQPRARLASERLVLGTMAIDPEDVVRADGSRLQAIALYHVDGGLIRRVWFIQG
jgi:hypothetical protein